jgi:CheY-like chemotaxis protein
MSTRTRPTILVVDDDPLFSFELLGTLKRAGYTVLSAANVCDAYSLLERQQIDLAVVDLNLPDKSGLELIHTARKTRTKLKILATTGALSDLHLEIARYNLVDLGCALSRLLDDEYRPGEPPNAEGVNGGGSAPMVSKPRSERSVGCVTGRGGSWIGGAGYDRSELRICERSPD